MIKLVVLTTLFAAICALGIQQGWNTGVPCDEPQGYFTKNNKSCDAYYVCHRGFWYEGRCPEPYWFNEENQGCDYQWNVDCEEDSETTTKEVTTSGSTKSDEGTGSPGETTESHPEPTKPEETTTISTEESTTISSEETTTISSEESTTKSSEESTTKSSEESTTHSTEETTTPSTTTTEAPDVNLDDFCAEGFLGALPHPFKCSYFILCFDGTAVERFCGDDLHYSAREKTCMPIDEANCVLDGTACPKENDPENIKVILNEYDCRGFYICFSQSPIPAYCGRGTHWNQAKETCELEAVSKCEPLPPPYPGYKNDEVECPTDDGEHLLPHPREKGKWFLCKDGKPSLLDYSGKSELEMVESV